MKFSVLCALIQRELHSWRNSVVLYSFCFLFVLFSLASMFILSGFLEANEADLARSFFKWHPWIFVFLLPVVAIRSWSEEHHSDLFEVLGTQPVSLLAIIIAKTLGASLVVLLALLLTFPAIITVLLLGDPDEGVILTSYLGSFLLGVSLLTLSQAFCVYMGGSIGSYISSVGASVILVLSGNAAIADTIISTFPALDWSAHILQSLSIMPKYASLTQGKIELSGILGFLFLSILSLCLSHQWLMSDRRAYNTKSSLFFRAIDRFPFVTLLLVYFMSTSIINFVPAYIDVTQESRFRLPKNVENELRNIDQTVSIRLYTSDYHADFGFELTNYKQRIEEALNLIVEQAPDKFLLQKLNPAEDSQSASLGQLDEIAGITDSSDSEMFFSIVIESLNNKRVFNNLSPSRQRNIVSNVIRAVLNVSTDGKKHIGIFSPFSFQRQDGVALQYWTGFDELKSSYKVSEIRELSSSLHRFDTVILFHSELFSIKEQKYLEDYLILGGNIVVYVDPYSLMFEMFSNTQALEGSASTLPKFVSNRGIELLGAHTVYDHDLATEQGTENGSSINPAVLSLSKLEINPNHAITNSFDLIQFIQAGSLEIKENPNYRTIELLRTSPKAKTLPVEFSHNRDQQKIDLAMGDSQVQGKTRTLAILQESIANKNEGKLVVVSDIDWLHSAIAGSENEAYGSPNKNTQLNTSIFDYLLGNTAINELRSRSALMRPLDIWSDIQSNILGSYSEVIALKINEITNYEEKLNLIEQARQLDNRQAASSQALLLQSSTIQRKIRNARAELSGLKVQADAKVSRIRNIIKWANILIVPFLIALFGTVILRIRQHKVRGISK